MGKYADALMGEGQAPEQPGAGKYSSQLLESPQIDQRIPEENGDVAYAIRHLGRQ